MPIKVKSYVYSVIAAGAMVTLGAGLEWRCRNAAALLMCLAITLLSSFLKLRLRGMPGTYSLNFLFILAGMCMFSLPETMLIAIAGALAQSLWQAKKRPTALQIAFNMANLTLTSSVCFGLAHGVFAAGFELYRPAVLALISAVYFVLNTVLVSGVLSLLEGKPLAEVCHQWYLWSFPYFLIGAAAVGVLPLGGHASPPSSWIVLLPFAYLLHFFYGLEGSTPDEKIAAKSGTSADLSLFHGYIAVVMGAAFCLLAVAIFGWDSHQLGRFMAYLCVAILASGCKISLPGIASTVSLGFVPVLVNIVELPFSQAIAISAVVSLVQCLWNTTYKPGLVQVIFSSSALVLSTAVASFVTHLAPEARIAGSLPLTLGLATVVLYGLNTVLIASAIGLSERRPVSSLWQRCYFYSFPYYLVGAVAAALMIFTIREAGWAPSMLVLPLMGLVYVSYRMHLIGSLAKS